MRTKRRRKTRRVKKTVKGALLKGVLENVPASAFDVIYKSISETMKGKAGIYALYDGDELYYVGLARSLRGRIRKHTKDKHSGNWDTFSFFIVEKTRYLKDLETLILRISNPKGNSTLGKIPSHHALQKILQKEIRETTKALENLKKGIKGKRRHT